MIYDTSIMLAYEESLKHEVKELLNQENMYEVAFNVTQRLIQPEQKPKKNLLHRATKTIIYFNKSIISLSLQNDPSFIILTFCCIILILIMQFNLARPEFFPALGHPIGHNERLDYVAVKVQMN
jgi:hypothetical protein